MSPINAIRFLWWLWLVLLVGGAASSVSFFETSDTRQYLRLSFVIFGGLFLLSVAFDILVRCGL